MKSPEAANIKRITSKDTTLLWTNIWSHTAELLVKSNYLSW